MSQWMLAGAACAALLLGLAPFAAQGEAGEAKEQLVETKIELPIPVYKDTPKDLEFKAHMEKPSGRPRPPFLAPKGTTNVALKKPVTSSDEDPGQGYLDWVTDGDKSGFDGSQVELKPGRQWVQIDLEATHRIYALVVWHYHGSPRFYHDVVVQVADDADFITNVHTLFNNDYDNSAGLGLGKDKEYLETYEGKLIEAKGVKARYVRLYSKGSTDTKENHYTEVEVYGQPAP